MCGGRGLRSLAPTVVQDDPRRCLWTTMHPGHRAALLPSAPPSPRSPSRRLSLRRSSAARHVGPGQSPRSGSKRKRSLCTGSRTSPSPVLSPATMPHSFSTLISQIPVLGSIRVSSRVPPATPGSARQGPPAGHQGPNHEAPPVHGTVRLLLSARGALSRTTWCAPSWGVRASHFSVHPHPPRVSEDQSWKAQSWEPLPGLSVALD